MRVSPDGLVSVKPRRPRFSGINISEHVNVLLGFRNGDEKRVFEAFQVQQSNKHLFLFFQIVENFIFMYGKLVTYNHFPTTLSLVSLFIALLTPVLLGWVLVVMYYKNQLFTNGRWKYLIKDSHIPMMESLWLVGTSISYALTIAAIGQNGDCPAAINLALSRTCGCNYSGSNELPEDKMIGSFFFPIMYSIIFKGIKYEAIIFSLFLDVLSVFFTLKYFNVTISIGTFIFYLLFSLVILYENRRQRISEFLVTQSQQDALDEVERLAEETHAKELRSMIGNVAHDLKTPVTAFVSGLEIQNSLLADMNDNINNPVELQKCFGLVQDSIQNMSDVNRFMMMSINRCIDYTKASNGVKLVPRLETVNFREMLNLPLNCMKNLQNTKVTVEMKPISDMIATNIITDPQWFQENLLCLLSNAFKYSPEGTVTISVALTTKVKIGTMASLRSLASTKEQRLLRVDVEDAGIGISDDVKQQLFNPFKQAQRLAGGTGLGLYSLARRLEALEGLYGVENRKDGLAGTDFWFAIPYRFDDTVDDKTPPLMKKENSLIMSAAGSTAGMEPPLTSGASTPNLSKSPSTKSILPRLNILLVDDSVSILKMSGKMLTRLGHTVTTAENGAVALRLITNTFQPMSGGSRSATPTDLLPKFDVVLMDLQMPIMDGLEATKRLRVLEEAYNNQMKDTHSSGVSQKYRPEKVHDIEDQIAIFGTTLDPPTTVWPPIGGSTVEKERQHQLIIGVSACSDDVTTGEAFAAGVDDFIPKPFSMQNFNDIYYSLVQRKQQQQLSQLPSKN